MDVKLHTDNFLKHQNRALKFIALFLFIFEISFAQISNLETRGMWILRDSMVETATIDSAIIYAYRSGFDKVFLQVRGRGEAFYQSEIVTNHSSVNEDFDPLEYATRIGHALGLEVHAWMNVYILWSSRRVPEDPKHIYHTHKEWTEANHFSKMDWRIDLSSPPAPNWEGVYLAPTHPDVNPYLRTVFNEVIQNYDIDGIHLDYVRYQDDFYGYNPDGRNEFEKIYNIDPMSIVRGIISTRFGWEQTEVDSITTAWNSFRQDKVTELVQYIRSDIEVSGKPIQLSAAVKPNLITASSRWLQNWKPWLENGLVDFVIPMNYYKDLKPYNEAIQIMKQLLRLESLDNVIMGIATYNQDAQASADKVIIARLNGFKGICVFSYDAHKNNLDWFKPVLNAIGPAF